MRRRTLVAAALLVLVSSALVPNSPYGPDVETDRRPFAPERPATLTEQSAGEYAADYEEGRLANDVIGSRGYTLDRGDDVWTDCAVASTTRAGADEYKVALRCRGGINDVYRIIQPTGASYTVTYRVTDEGTVQAAIDGYPFSPRDDLREAPWVETETVAA